MKVTASANDAQLRSRIEFLTKAMRDIDVNHDEYISREELFMYLDRKAEREFDRNIANEIFEHMDKNHDGTITVDEFIRVYLEADEILRKKIETAKQNKDYYQRQHEENQKKSQEARITEKQNSYGIMDGSFVHVTVVAARDLKAVGLSGVVDPFVEVSLDGGQSFKTKVINDNPNPTWNEKFTLEVATGTSQLKFSLNDYGGLTGGNVIGEVVVPLTELKDQTIHDTWLDLFDRNGRRVQGDLNVKLHWIHSKVKYYATAAEKWKEAYEKECEELEELHRYLENLWDPFQGMSQFKAGDGYMRHSAKSEIGAFDRRVHHAVTNVTSKFMPETANETVLTKIASTCCLITIGMAFLMSLDRNVFIEFAYSIIVLLHVHKNLFSETMNWRVLSLMVLASFLFIDIPFEKIYPGNWNKNTQAVDANLLSGVRTFVDVITYIHFPVKIVEMLVFYAIYVQQKKAANPRVSIRKMNPTV